MKKKRAAIGGRDDWSAWAPLAIGLVGVALFAWLQRGRRPSAPVAVGLLPAPGCAPCAAAARRAV